MKIIYNKKKIQKIIKNQPDLGFVPTMGNIHKGHLSLVKHSQKRCKKTVVSIYVNKPQFNKKNDFLKYPRTIKKDIELLKKAKVDYLFIPKDNDIYSEKKNRKIEIIPFSKQLCGKFRPNHFVAVVDVLDRFVNIIKPKKIFMGEKDMQQLKIVQDYINKNFINTRVIGCKTIREKYGTPLSSRNNHLSYKEKDISSEVYKIIFNNKKKIIYNQISLINLKKNIFKLGVAKIDYIKVLDINKIIKSNTKISKYKIFIAYYLGATRLIDNI
jgi:pantoate--beta-alanine ligase